MDLDNYSTSADSLFDSSLLSCELDPDDTRSFQQDEKGILALQDFLARLQSEVENRLQQARSTMGPSFNEN